MCVGIVLAVVAFKATFISTRLVATRRNTSQLDAIRLRTVTQPTLMCFNNTVPIRLNSN